MGAGQGQRRLVDGAYFEGLDSPDVRKFFFPNPLRATASTHHRRDEQSNADGNLTGFLQSVVLHRGRRIKVVWLKPRLPTRLLCFPRSRWGLEINPFHEEPVR